MVGVNETTIVNWEEERTRQNKASLQKLKEVLVTLGYGFP